MRRELAGKDLGGGAERLGAAPDPLGPLIVLLALVAHAVVEVLIVRAAPEERFEASLGAEQPRLRVRMAEGLCSRSFRERMLRKWRKKAVALTSICHVPRGMAVSPKFFVRNWWPRVVCGGTAAGSAADGGQGAGERNTQVPTWSTIST